MSVEVAEIVVVPLEVVLFAAELFAGSFGLLDNVRDYMAHERSAELIGAAYALVVDAVGVLNTVVVVLDGPL